MRVYPEVPHLWYACLGFAALIMMMVTVEIFPTKLPIWALFVALSLGGILAVPAGMIQAITNQSITFQVMHEMLAGYMLPGRPVANMVFKCVAFTATGQAIGFSGDLKLGHYMKIPPRTMFMGQVVATFVSCFVVALVQNWAFANIADICTPTQVNGFFCPSGGNFATASVIWGSLGPARLFGPGQMLVISALSVTFFADLRLSDITRSCGFSCWAHWLPFRSISSLVATLSHSGDISISLCSSLAPILCHLLPDLTIRRGFWLDSSSSGLCAVSTSVGGCDITTSSPQASTQASHWVSSSSSLPSSSQRTEPSVGIRSRLGGVIRCVSLFIIVIF
jgi:hypothetical protein